MTEERWSGPQVEPAATKVDEIVSSGRSQRDLLINMARY